MERKTILKRIRSVEHNVKLHLNILSESKAFLNVTKSSEYLPALKRDQKIELVFTTLVERFVEIFYYRHSINSKVFEQMKGLGSAAILCNIVKHVFRVAGMEPEFLHSCKILTVLQVSKFKVPLRAGPYELKKLSLYRFPKRLTCIIVVILKQLNHWNYRKFLMNLCQNLCLNYLQRYKPRPLLIKEEIRIFKFPVDHRGHLITREPTLQMINGKLFFNNITQVDKIALLNAVKKYCGTY